MLNKNSSTRGFTIIEVLIVLAIAAVILLVVFMAVPAMQRNSRNTQRKHDVALINAARQEYDMTYHAVIVAASGTCSPTSPGSYSTLCSYVKNLGYYEPENITFISNAYTAPTSVPNPDTEHVVSATYLACDGNTPTTAGASSHSVAVVFAVEASGGAPLRQCVEAAVIGH